MMESGVMVTRRAAVKTRPLYAGSIPGSPANPQP